MISGCHAEENPESNSAAGTLLMIWLARTATAFSFPCRKEKKKGET